MKILAIDTSGPVCGVALLKDGAVAYEAAAVNKLTHSVNLMPMVDEALRRGGMTVGDVDLFAAVTGPGSFTGIRIGVSTVKGMAHALNKPCVGVNALQALAGGIMMCDALLCPIQDARAGQVYGAAFLPGMPPVRVLPDMAEKLEVFLDKCLEAAEGRRLCFAGDGVAPFRDRISEKLGDRAVFPPAHMGFLRPAAVALLAEADQDRAVDYLTLMPVYLRPARADKLPRYRDTEAKA